MFCLSRTGISYASYTAETFKGTFVHKSSKKCVPFNFSAVVEMYSYNYYTHMYINIFWRLDITNLPYLFTSLCYVYHISMNNLLPIPEISFVSLRLSTSIQTLERTQCNMKEGAWLIIIDYFCSLLSQILNISFLLNICMSKQSLQNLFFERLIFQNIFTPSYLMISDRIFWDLK